MEISNLFNEMKSQQELLQKFLDLIYLQQKAIINNDIVVLEDLLTNGFKKDFNVRHNYSACCEIFYNFRI